jgi:type I restriction enzyme M protein
MTFMHFMKSVPLKYLRLIHSKSDNNLAGGCERRYLRSFFERNAQDVKGGAGQYFTPRLRIDSDHLWSSAFGRAKRAKFRYGRYCQAMVEVMQPKSTDNVADPA